jgi:two-component system, cell cycle sensor histidine kinase and response regulator CckA
VPPLPTPRALTDSTSPSDLDLLRGETLRAVIRASPAAIVAVDVAGRVRLWNDAAERLLGWSADEVLGKPLPTLRKDGTPVELSSAEAPVHDANGRVVGTVAVLSDAGESRRMQAQVLEAQKMEAVGRLAGGIAHDFNNILSGIKGFAAVMVQDLPPGAPFHEEVLQILRAAERAETLTRHLLAFSRRQVMEPSVLDLGTLVDSLLPLLRRLIGEDIELFTSCHGETRVVVDPTQIEQIVLNLAVNARDSMPQGGRLTIAIDAMELSAESIGPLGVGDLAPGPYVMMEVSDTGVGMDRATQARIFEPFFTTKPRGRGTGLGLSTAYGIVRQSGGHITVHSEVGRGATFRVYLPRTEAAVAPTHESYTFATSPGGSETVLLAEDDDLVRGLAAQVLRRNGYEVLEAASGEEALALAGRHDRPINLLLSDVIMPRMSGRQLAESLRRWLPDLPVLFMSGYNAEALASHGIDERTDDLLEKPFTTTALLDRIRGKLDEEKRAPGALERG